MDDRPGRRALTKAQNRETILAAARGVFAELGFAAATVRDVIRATPLASGTFYNYFKSKEEVYQALRDQVALEVRPALRQARQAAGTGADFVAANFRVYFRFIAQRRGGVAAAAEASRFRMDSPEVLAGLAELQEDISAAIARGLFPPLDAGLLAAAISGIAFEVGEGVKRGRDPDAAATFAAGLIMGGIKALAASPQAPSAPPPAGTPPTEPAPPRPDGADSPS
jgi:AcrR family transcriptional regulator